MVSLNYPYYSIKNMNIMPQMVNFVTTQNNPITTLQRVLVKYLRQAVSEMQI